MILLLGATGLLGGQVLRKMLERKYPARLYIRGSSDWKDASISDLKRRGVEMTIADFTDAKAIVRAVEGCTAVINIAGSMRLNKNIDFDLLHVEAVQNLVQIAEEKGVQRVIHISCLGAQEESESDYFYSKWQSEELIRKGNFYWTVFRPSYLFGEKFPLLDILMPLIKFRLCMPILGSGVNIIQPVHVDNVAECIVDSIYNKDTVGQTYDLAGPEQFTMSEFMELARKELGVGGPVFNVPTTTVAKAVSALSKLMPNVSINEEAASLIMSESKTDSNALGTVFPTKLVALDELLPTILDAY